MMRRILLSMSLALACAGPAGARQGADSVTDESCYYKWWDSSTVDSCWQPTAKAITMGRSDVPNACRYRAGCDYLVRWVTKWGGGGVRPQYGTNYSSIDVPYDRIGDVSNCDGTLKLGSC